MFVPIDSVQPNPRQPRTEFDPQALQELADSIREHGVIQPIVVEPAGDGYFILDGERRWRAARIAGLASIPVSVRTGAGDPRDRLLLALIANVQREDLNPIEEARAYAALRDEFSMTVQEISRSTGKHYVHIGNRLVLLETDPEIQELIASRALHSDARVARALRNIPDREARLALARRAAEGKHRINTILTAAAKVNAALDKPAKPQVEEETPSLARGLERAHHSLDLPKWDALAQAGRTPPWAIVEQAARDICDTCSLRSMASAGVCRECPLPAFIARTIDLAMSAAVAIPAPQFLTRRPVYK